MIHVDSLKGEDLLSSLPGLLRFSSHLPLSSYCAVTIFTGDRKSTYPSPSHHFLLLIRPWQAVCPGVVSTKTGAWTYTCEQRPTKVMVRHEEVRRVDVQVNSTLFDDIWIWFHLYSPPAVISQSTSGY